MIENFNSESKLRGKQLFVDLGKPTEEIGNDYNINSMKLKELHDERTQINLQELNTVNRVIIKG